MLHAHGVVGKARVLAEGLAPAGDLEEGVPLFVGIGQQADVAVLGLERLALGIGHADIGPLACRRIIDIAVHVLDQVEAGHALHHRHLDELTLAGPGVVEHGRQDGLGHEVAAHLVGDQHGQQAWGRIAVGAVEDVRQARGRLDQVVIGRLARVGTVRAIARAMHIDDVGLDRLDGVVVEAQPRQAVVAHRGGEHVAGLDQPAQRLLGFLLAQVEQHRALVAVDGHEDGAEVVRRALGRMAGPAHDVAAPAAPPARELDLDHIGAEVAQHLGRIGPEDHGGHVEDAHALQRAGGFGGERMGLAGHVEAPPVAASAAWVIAYHKSDRARHARRIRSVRRGRGRRVPPRLAALRRKT